MNDYVDAPITVPVTDPLQSMSDTELCDLFQDIVRFYTSNSPDEMSRLLSRVRHEQEQRSIRELRRKYPTLLGTQS